MNLRGGESTDGEVVKKVLIGTECQKLEGAQKKGWVRLKCGEAEGFTLEKLVGADKPNLEALLAQAQDAAKSTKERLDAAARAATLDPQNEQASQLLTQLFFDVNFEQLAKDKRKGGLHESFLVLCNPRGMQDSRTHEQCLTDELEKIEYDWHQLRIRDDRFVSAMFREGNLVVYTGYMKARAKGRFDPGDDEFNIIIESRSSSTVSDTLKACLQKGRVSRIRTKTNIPPSTRSPRTCQRSPMRTTNCFVRSPVWYQLQEENGERFIRVNCGAIVGNVLQVDIHRRASLQHGDLPAGDYPPKVERIKSISKNDSTYTMQLCTREECWASLTLLWPTTDPGISHWKTEPSTASEGIYSTSKGKPNKVRYWHCNEADQ
ncbi:hypothetical protein ACN28S_09205 [Cystobacter fuscus]